MAAIVVAGGSVAGLATALFASRAGYQVTVIEQDAAEPPDSVEDVWRGWRRRGLQQFRQIHGYKAITRTLLERLAPDVLRALYEVGAIDMVYQLGRDDDEGAGSTQFVSLRCRRTTFEWALRRSAAEDARVSVKRGAVHGLLTTRGGERVIGVRTSSGDIEGYVVVDATGRRSSQPAWCAEAGLPIPDKRRIATDQIYLTQWFRRATPFTPTDPVVILQLGFANLAFVPVDHGWWSATFLASARDAALREALMTTPRFLSVLRAVPEAEQWLEGSAVEGRVLFLSKFVNHRRDGRAVPGLVSLGDSLVATNPLYGYGFALAFAGGAELVDMLRTVSPPDVAETFARWADRRILPWYADAVALDIEVNRSWNGGGEITGPQGSRLFSMRDAGRAANVDPVVGMAFARYRELLSMPEEFWCDREIAARVRVAVASGETEAAKPFPTREQLLEAASHGS